MLTLGDAHLHGIDLMNINTRLFIMPPAQMQRVREAPGCLLFRNHQGLMHRPALSTSVMLMWKRFWLCNLQGQLPPWVKLPCSAALPFGAFEAVLQQPENAASAAAVHKLHGVQQPSSDQLEQLRVAVQDLQASAHLQDEVKAAFQQSGDHLLPHCVSASALLVITCVIGVVLKPHCFFCVSSAFHAAKPM